MPSLISNPVGMLWPVGIYNVLPVLLWVTISIRPATGAGGCRKDIVYCMPTGGSVGILSGMYLFHQDKTSKFYAGGAGDYCFAAGVTLVLRL